MRRSWRIMSAFALILAAASILFSAYLFTQIQTSRERAVFSNCQDVNTRHDRTLEELARGYERAARGATPARLRQLEESRRFTTVIVERLVPMRDCAGLAERQVATTP